MRLDRPLGSNRLAYLKKFAATKRVYRDEKVLGYYSDPVRHGVELPVGKDGEFFVGNDGMDPNDRSIIDEDETPASQPSEWCSWEPNDAGTELVVNSHSDFDTDVDWLKYVVDKFLVPWGHVLSGQVTLTEEGETLKVTVCNNAVAWETAEDVPAVGSAQTPPPVQDTNYRVLDDKWNMLVGLKNELVRSGLPAEVATKVLAGTSYKSKIQSKDEYVSKAVNLYKMLSANGFDVPEAVKLTVSYLVNN